ncbi:hypothetical protein HII31_07844 [Pseudocercospora fuligena]|uniref:Elongin-A n=1 Tax=Pseudocercospora fuligena TaxID=685502 RepID=A0A8H6VL30_9PEZI|nr:hypothetical protein HII31_07844 [Pseudocercospora fuligena]
MPVPTLFAIAIRCAQRHVASITDFDGIPQEMAMPILKKVESPQQLREIEINNPSYAESGNNAGLWQCFIRRDIREIAEDEEKMPYPNNPASWYKVYRMLMRKQADKEKEQEEALRQQLLGQKVQKAEKQALFVPGVMAHARDEKETTIYVDGVRNKNTGGWEKKPPSVKTAKTGHDAIAAMRRQAASNSRQRQIAQPWKATQASRQIKQAPQSMIRDITRKTPQEFAPRELLPHEKEMLKDRQRMNANIKIQAPGKVASVKHAEAVQKRNEMAVRKAREIDEARLRQLTKSENAKARAAPPEKKFDFETPAPEYFVPSTEAIPHTTPVKLSLPVPYVNGKPVAKQPSMSPPKRTSPSASPERNPAGIRKRPAPSSIFAPKPKKIIKR